MHTYIHTYIHIHGHNTYTHTYIYTNVDRSSSYALLFDSNNVTNSVIVMVSAGEDLIGSNSRCVSNPSVA